MLGIGNVQLELASITVGGIPLTLLLTNVLHVPCMTANVICWSKLASEGFFISTYQIQDVWNLPGTQPWHRPGQCVLSHWTGLVPFGFVDNLGHLKLRLYGQAADETYLNPQLLQCWHAFWPQQERARWNIYRGNHGRGN